MTPPFLNNNFVYHFNPPEYYIHLHEWEQLDRGALRPHTALPLHHTVCTALEIPHLPPPLEAFSESSVSSPDSASPDSASPYPALPEPASPEPASPKPVSAESMAHRHSRVTPPETPAPPSSEPLVIGTDDFSRDPNHQALQATTQRHVAAEEASRRVPKLSHPHPGHSSHNRQNPKNHQPAGQHSQRPPEDHEHRQATPHYEPFPQSGNHWQFKVPPRLEYPFDWDDPDSRGLPKHPDAAKPGDGQGQQPNQPLPREPKKNQSQQNSYKNQAQPSAARGFFYKGDPGVGDKPAAHHRGNHHENLHHDIILDREPHRSSSEAHRGRKHHGDKVHRPVDQPGKEKDAQRGGHQGGKQPGQPGGNPGGNQEPDPHQELLNRERHRRNHSRKPSQRDRSRDPQERKDGRHGDKQPGQQPGQPDDHQGGDQDADQRQEPDGGRQGGNNGEAPGEKDPSGGHQGDHSGDNQEQKTKSRDWPDKENRTIGVQGWRDDHRRHPRDRYANEREDSDSEDSRPSRPSPGSETRSPRPSRPPQGKPTGPHDKHQHSGLLSPPVPSHLNPKTSDNVQQWLDPAPYENHHHPQEFGHPHLSPDSSESSDGEVRDRSPQNQESRKDKRGFKGDGNQRVNNPGNKGTAPRGQQRHEGKHGPHEDSGSSQSGKSDDGKHEPERRQDEQDGRGRRQPGPDRGNRAEIGRDARHQKPEKTQHAEEGRSRRHPASGENHHAEDYRDRRQAGPREGHRAEDGSGRKHPGSNEDQRDVKDDRNRRHPRPIENHQTRAIHGRKHQESGEDHRPDDDRGRKHPGSEDDQNTEDGMGRKHPGSDEPSPPSLSTPSSLSVERNYHQYARDQLRQIPPPSNSADDREMAMGDRVYSMGELKELFALKAGIDNADFERVHKKLEEIISAVKQLNQREGEEDALLDRLAQKVRAKSDAGELANRKILESFNAYLKNLDARGRYDMRIVDQKMQEMEAQMAQIREERLQIKEHFNIEDPTVHSDDSVSNGDEDSNEDESPGCAEDDTRQNQGGIVEDPQQQSDLENGNASERSLEQELGDYEQTIRKIVLDHIEGYDEEGPFGMVMLGNLLKLDSNNDAILVNSESFPQVCQRIARCVRDHEDGWDFRGKEPIYETLFDRVLEEEFAEYLKSLRRLAVDAEGRLKDWLKRREEASKQPKEDPDATVEPHQEATRESYHRLYRNPHHDLQQREDSLRAGEAQRRAQRRRQERQQREEADKRRREAGARPPERPLDDWERHQRQKREEEERRRELEEDKKKRGGFMSSFLDRVAGYAFALGSAVFVLGQNGGLETVSRNL